MSDIIGNHAIATELVKRGLVPAHCRVLDVHIDVRGPVILRYEKFLTADELVQFAEAWAAVASGTARP